MISETYMYVNIAAEDVAVSNGYVVSASVLPYYWHSWNIYIMQYKECNYHKIEQFYEIYFKYTVGPIYLPWANEVNLDLRPALDLQAKAKNYHS